MEMEHRRVEEEQLPEVDDTSSDSSDSGKEENQNASSPKSVYLDENEGMWKCHHCIWTHKNGHSWTHHFHQKPFIQASRDVKLQWSVSGKNLGEDESDISNIVNVVVNHEAFGDSRGEILSFSTTSNPQVEDENTSQRVVTEESVTVEVVEESDEEVIELEFERAVEKLHTHTPYCPNCNNQITKVTLRRKKRSPRAERPLDLLGCLRCFSIFVPSGDCLNPFNIFGPKPEVESTNAGDVQPSASVGGTTANAAGKQSLNPFNCFGSKTEVESPKIEVPSTKIESPKIEVPPTEAESPKIHFKYPSTDVPSTSTSATVNAAVAPGGSNLWIFGKTEGYERVESKAEGDVEKEEDKPQTPLDHVVVVDTGSPTETPNVPVISGVGQRVISDVPQRSATYEILKCIVYGGLISSIASLSVVSSAAASDATTLNVITIGLATLISSLIAFFYNLVDLRNENYEELLGQKGHFLLHSTFAIFAYLVFGLVAPITYAFAFRESDDRDYKIIAVAAAGFACVFILAIAKAYIRKTANFGGYVKTIIYYISMAVAASGVAYAAGDLIGMLLDKYGWFEPAQEVSSLVSGWASSY